MNTSTAVNYELDEPPHEEGPSMPLPDPEPEDDGPINGDEELKDK